MTQFSNQQLVITAIGEDRSGIVSELTQLVSDCACNILDSRIAILGNELTFLMLLNGDMSAISRVEHTLPSRGMELGLMTMMKRTNSHLNVDFSSGYTLQYHGQDSPGTLSKVTKFFAESNINICSLKSNSLTDDDDFNMRCEIEFNIPTAVNVEEFKIEFEDLSHDLNVDYILKRIR